MTSTYLETKGYAYILESETGRIKIGWTGGVVRIRARSIQTSNVVKTRLVAVVPASLKQEKSLHEMLGTYHLWGEWYDFPPRLDAYVRSLFGIGVNRIPDWSEQGPENKQTISARIKRGILAHRSRKAALPDHSQAPQ